MRKRDIRSVPPLEHRMLAVFLMGHRPSGHHSHVMFAFICISAAAISPLRRPTCDACFPRRALNAVRTLASSRIVGTDLSFEFNQTQFARYSVIREKSFNCNLSNRKRRLSMAS